MTSTDMPVESFFARAVFFVDDAERALEFYTKKLGFSLDWSHQEQGRAYVFQVSLHGFSLILNQTHEAIRDRAGHGRVFLGLEDDQIAVLRRHIEQWRIESTMELWGAPTLCIRDLDGNEIYVFVPRDEWPRWEAELNKPQP
jgi:catechol 2,3-dioxygenase-like lactoylglutathione lyase family enzyme